MLREHCQEAVLCRYRTVTRGGLIGVIDKVEEQTLRLEAGSGLKFRVRRDYVDRVMTD